MLRSIVPISQTANKIVPSTDTALPDLADLDRPALEQLFEAAGLPRFRARQVFRSIYRKGETDVARMNNLGATVRAEIGRRSGGLCYGLLRD